MGLTIWPHLHHLCKGNRRSVQGTFMKHCPTRCQQRTKTLKMQIYTTPPIYFLCLPMMTVRNNPSHVDYHWDNASDYIKNSSANLASMFNAHNQGRRWNPQGFIHCIERLHCNFWSQHLSISTLDHLVHHFWSSDSVKMHSPPQKSLDGHGT